MRSSFKVKFAFFPSYGSHEQCPLIHRNEMQTHWIVQNTLSKLTLRFQFIQNHKQGREARLPATLISSYFLSNGHNACQPQHWGVKPLHQVCKPKFFPILIAIGLHICNCSMFVNIKVIILITLSPHKPIRLFVFSLLFSPHKSDYLFVDIVYIILMSCM